MKDNIKAAIDRYVKGCPVGDFLQCVLSNDLIGAMGRADDDNRRDLFEICSYVYNHTPSISHGSPKRYKDWLTQKAKEYETIQVNQTPA